VIRWETSPVSRQDQHLRRALAAAESELGAPLPRALRRCYLERDGWFNGPDSGEWWVIWPLGRVVEENLRSWGEGTLARDLVAFGDDGIGNPFCIPLSGDADDVVRWNWIDSEVEVQEGSFDHFRRAWCLGDGAFRP
jgi:hypothetical protein